MCDHSCFRCWISKTFNKLFAKRIEWTPTDTLAYRPQPPIQHPAALEEVAALRNFGKFHDLGGISHEKKEVFGLNLSELNEKK